MGVFLVAAGVLAFEVLLMRVFSVVMWYHFASMAIAVAMFGIAAGGLVPYLLRRRPASLGETGAGPPDLDRVSPTVPVLFSAASLATALFPYALLLAFARYPRWGGRLLSLFHQPYFEPFRAAGASAPPTGEAFQVGFLLLFLSLPFVGAGAIFSLAFSRQGREGRTYLEVMGGSAAGVLAYLAVMGAGSGPAAFLFLATLFSLAAAAFSRGRGGRPERSGDGGGGSSRRLAALFLALSGLLVLGGVLEARYGFAEIRFVRGRYEPGLLWTRWDASSRVAVYPVSSEEASKAWGMSPAYEGPVPRQIGMVVDDAEYSALFGTGEDPASLEAFRFNLASVAYRIVGSGSALVIGPGGGKDILCALSAGGFSVTAVEVNPLVIRATDDVFGAFTGGPYADPRVRTYVAEGRSFLSSTRERYDVIQMTQLFGQFLPSAGAFTMTEDYLYTTEAFREYLAHLTDRGVLTVTRFVYERRVWRILAVAREALLSLGADEPARHLLVLRDRGLVNILVRRTPWRPEEVALAERLSTEMRFPLILSPVVKDRTLPGKILEDSYEGRYDLSAPTDDRPFFHYTHRPADFLSASLTEVAEFDDRSVSLLRGFLASSALLCSAFLIVPALLLIRGNPDRPGVAASAYMFLCGLAFIVWEIVMIRKLSLLFGTPVLSLAAGLALILAFSGGGGYLGGRKGSKTSGAALLFAVAAVTAYLYLMGELLARGAGEALPVRILLAAAYLLPPSMVMGQFFPMGLVRFSSPGRSRAPFFFAANGAASVLGAAATQAIALNLGYRVTTAVGAALYAACAVLLLLSGKEKR